MNAPSVPSLPSDVDVAAWQALKRLGDAALAQGGIQAVLHMFVGSLTGAEAVARASDEAGHAEATTTQLVAQWLATEYVPEMLQALHTPTNNE